MCHPLYYMSALYQSLVWLPWLVDVWREMAAVFGHSNTLASTFPVLSGSVVLPQPSLPLCFWRKLRMSINFLQEFFWSKSICNLLFFFVSLVFQLGEGQVRHYNSGRSADQWRTGEGRKIRKDGNWEVQTRHPHFCSIVSILCFEITFLGSNEDCYSLPIRLFRISKDPFENSNTFFT